MDAKDVFLPLQPIILACQTRSLEGPCVIQVPTLRKVPKQVFLVLAVKMTVYDRLTPVLWGWH